MLPASVGDQSQLLIFQPNVLSTVVRSECLFGGDSILRLREQMAQFHPSLWPQLMVKQTSTIGSKPATSSTELTIGDILEREERNQEESGEVDYLSWIACENSPFKKGFLKFNTCYRAVNDIVYSRYV